MTDNYSPHRHVVVEKQETNVPAVAGFTMSILSLFVCGLLSIPAAIVCIVGLQGDRPKGMAVSGLVLSSVPIIGWIIVFAFFSASAGLAEKAKIIREEQFEKSVVQELEASKRQKELEIKEEKEKRLRDFKTPDVPKPRPGMRFVPTVDNEN